MSTPVRIAAVLGTVVILIVAFIAFAPKEEGGSSTAFTTSAPATTPAASAPDTTGDATTNPQAQPAAPQYTPIVVKGAKAVGGVQKIEVRNGDRVRLQVSSPDTSDEIHLHGYDLTRDLKAGGKVRFVFTADADGIFEMELEGAGARIAQVVVRP